MRSKLVNTFRLWTGIISQVTCCFALLVSISGFAQSTDQRTIHVKFKEEFVPSSTTAARSGMQAMDLVSQKYNAENMQRIFPEAGVHEKAHRAYGLHLWYKIKFPQGTDTTRAIQEYKNLQYFYSVEACREYTAGWDRKETATPVVAPTLPSSANDPLYKSQWHYNNTGQSGGTPGADINLAKAWRIETGSPNVIVAVIDGGVDINHPDLKAALWRNAGEIAGNGVDDDRNGYQDDIHGFGFGDSSPTIYPDVHGTHVAGTIGAISNNGLGVAGVAGGSGTADGVRIMSLAAFGKFNNDNFEEAMVYAADNGAVISQNSWGGGSSAIEAAINYFVDRAGYDNSDENFTANIQTGPMAGGLVIFAAGNDNTTDVFFGYPSSYPKVIAVASTTHNDVKAGSSNYGPWVDIAAPGANVLSTLPNSDYGYLSGTSMACPHVSGVAALLISYLQQPGLKPIEIRNRLTQTARSIDGKNPNYIGMLGSGRLNAFSMFAKRDMIPPGRITDLHAASITSTSITLQWTAPAESGNDGGPPEKYDIRMSTTPIDENNFSLATPLAAPVPALPGQHQTITVGPLQMLGQYHFALKSTDVFSATSPLSNVVTASTTQIGIFEADRNEVEVSLRSGQTSTQEIELRHIDFGLNVEKFDLTFRYPDDSLSWVIFSNEHIFLEEGEIKNTRITINAAGLAPGEYSGQIQLLHRNAFIMLNVTLHLTVIAPAGLDVQENVDLGRTVVNMVSDSTIILHNLNAEELIISNIESSDSRVIVSSNTATLAPGQQFPLTISVTGEEPGSIDATITFTVNDPEVATIVTRVRAELIANPGIVVNPTAINTTLSLSETKTVTVALTNTGTDLFRWTTNYPAPALPSASVNQFVTKASSPVELTALSYDPIGGFIYGKAALTPGFYRYNFNTNSWTSMAAGPSTIYGQAVYLNGKIYHSGQNLEIYTIQSNSWSTISYPVPAECYTTTTDGQYVYAALGKALYRYDPATESWLQLVTFTGGYSNTIGALSHRNGIIYVAEDATQGITGDGNTPFFKYYINSNTWSRSTNLKGKVSWGSAIDPVGEKYFVHQSTQLDIRDLRDNTEVQRTKPFVSQGYGSMIYVDKPGFTGIYSVHGSTSFIRYETAPSPTSWISVSPSQGEIPAGATQTLTVRVGSPELVQGTHTTDLIISSGDLSAEIQRITVTATVSNIPDISLSKSSADVGDAGLGWGRSYSLKISNTGSAQLVVSNIVSDNVNFSISATTYTILPGEFVFTAPSFQPLTPGPSTGTFTFHSNDPDQPLIQFTLSGKGVTTAIPQVTPVPLSVNMFSGDKTVQDLLVTNAGEGTVYASLGSDEGWLKKLNEVLVPPSETQKIQALFNSSGKSTGVYVDTAYLFYTDFLSPSDVLEIPVSMSVTSAPGIQANTSLIDFGNFYIDNTFDSMIHITNQGDLPLSITAISLNNSAFSINVSAPLNLAPGESVEAIVSFNPASVGSQNGTITFTTNDPSDGTYLISLSGTGVTVPDLATSIQEIQESARTGEEKQQTFTIANAGGSNLTWQLTLGAETEYDGNLVARSGPPQIGFTSTAVNPATGLLYGQSPRQNGLYEYSPVTDQWTNVAGRAPGINTFVHASAVVLNSQLYCFFDQTPSTLHVYNISLKEWSTTPILLSAAPTAITTDGNVLYVAAGNVFKSYDPATGIWITLPAPALTGINGLQYFNGSIYAHAGTGLAAYSRSSGTWRNLPDAPSAMAEESALDTSSGLYYAFSADGKNLYEYNIVSQYWSVINIPFFTVTNGTLAYVPNAGVAGVYFSQGDLGSGFARYEPFSSANEWLNVSPRLDTLNASASQEIDLYFNAKGLNTGTYETILKITSNDPVEPIKEIPVVFEVTNPGAAIKVPSMLEAAFDRLEVYTTSVKIENIGGAPLTWSLSNALPAGLIASKSSGTIAAGSFENITLTFTPAFLSPRIFNYDLQVNSNDAFAPTVSTRLKFTITTPLNTSPALDRTFEDQSVLVDAPPLEISLAGTFSDPDGDPIQYSVTSPSTEIASLITTGEMLKIFIFNPGTLTVTVSGTDSYNATTSTDFFLTVNDLITGTETSELGNTIRSFPNPFTNQFTIRYRIAKPSHARVMVFDTSGQLVWQSGDYVEGQGENDILIAAQQLASGIYHCRVIRKDGEAATIRILKN